MIWLTVPFAAAARTFVTDHLGRGAPLFAVFLLFALALALSLNSLRSRNLPVSAYLWIAVVAGGFAVRIYDLRDRPVEAVHYAEYGLLSVLAYRALVFRIRDAGVYGLSVLLAVLAGLFDEAIQWATPGRVWDMRDIRFNTEAAALAQIGLATGLRPGLVSAGLSAASLRRIGRVAALVFGVTALCFVNTPPRVDWYASRVAPLSFLRDSENAMVEYGFEYRDPEIGVFRSRFSPAQLRRYDARRGPEVASILDNYKSRASFAGFRARYTVINDPYVHEAGIHVFRRDRLFERAELREASNKPPGENYDEALRENRILQKYYPTMMSASRHRWPEATLERVEARAESALDFDSAVSRHLVTRFSERQVVGALVIAVAGMLLLGFFPGRTSGMVKNP